MLYILSEEEYRELRSAAEREAPEAHFFEVRKPVSLGDCSAAYTRRVLELCQGNVSEAAKVLRVHRHTVAKVARGAQEPA